VRAAAGEAEDALRRDFTVNALYLDVLRDEIIDPTGGLEDLRHHVLRAIGDPLVRLEEDAIRLLRAVRFAARYDLVPDVALEAALRAKAAGLARLSGERVRSEVTKLVMQRNAGKALLLLVDLGLADVVLPEIAALRGVPQPPEFHPEGDVLTHTALLLDRLPRKSEVLGWAGLLHDIGKPATLEFAQDRIRFSGHDRLSARMARDVFARLGASGAWTDAVCEIVDLHIWIASLPQMRDAKRNRFLLRPDVEDHLAFHEADCRASHGDLSILEFARDAMARIPAAAHERLVTGADVLALGLPPGPVVGEILREIEEQVLEGMIADRPAALAAVRQAVAVRVKAGRLQDR
jgi:poly(A) polymerase